MILLIIGHFLGAEVPTWFYHGESWYYMSNARQYSDFNFQSLFYGNPFSYLKNPENVYFQFQTILNGIMFHISKLNPGAIWTGFGLVCGIIYINISQRFFLKIGIGKSTLLIFTILFFWGGGVHSLAGFFHETIISGGSVIDGIKAFEKFDIADGWWMHSIGRNFILPNYTYYHLLVIIGLYFLVQKKYSKLNILLFILSFSHPFVGAQFISSVLCWQLFEKFYLKKEHIKLNAILGTSIILCLHLAYYFVFLRTSTEHALQEVQWSVTYDTLYKNWAYQAKNFIPSYLLVWAVFFISIRTPERFFNLMKDPLNRFLLIFGIINFVLANHEFAIKPIQPIHFTQGFVWFPFLLLGRREITLFIEKLFSMKKLSFIGIVFFIIFFTFDNITWMGKRIGQAYKGVAQTEIFYSKKQKEVVDFINSKYKEPVLSFVPTQRFGIMLTVYTPLRVLASHNNVTPEFHKRFKIQESILNTGIVPEPYNENETIIITKNQLDRNRLIFSNDKYYVYQVLKE